MRWLRALLKNASLAGAPKYIEHFSKFSPSPLSMKQFLDFGTEWAPRVLGGADGGVPAKKDARGRERPCVTGKGCWEGSGQEGVNGEAGTTRPEGVVGTWAEGSLD